MKKRAVESSHRVNAARRYTKTGSFNKLAGRSTAPGSEIPEHFFMKRRVLAVVLVLLALLPGIVALFR